jgi:hypothetical protein
VSKRYSPQHPVLKHPSIFVVSLRRETAFHTYEHFTGYIYIFIYLFIYLFLQSTYNKAPHILPCILIDKFISIALRCIKLYIVQDWLLWNDFVSKCVFKI